jgi:hypothetical protein
MTVLLKGPWEKMRIMVTSVGLTAVVAVVVGTVATVALVARGKRRAKMRRRKRRAGQAIIERGRERIAGVRTERERAGLYFLMHDHASVSIPTFTDWVLTRVLVL